MSAHKQHPPAKTLVLVIMALVTVPKYRALNQNKNKHGKYPETHIYSNDCDHVSLKTYIARRYGPESVKLVKHLERARKKCEGLEESLTFLKKCRDADIIPVCVRLKPRNDIYGSAGVLRYASVKLLRKVIRNAGYQHDKCEVSYIIYIWSAVL